MKLSSADKFPLPHCYSMFNWAQSNIQFIFLTVAKVTFGALTVISSYPFIPSKAVLRQTYFNPMKRLSWGPGQG